MEAVNTTEPAPQNVVGPLGVIVAVFEFTVTTEVVLFEHPLTVVPIIVYVVVIVGLAVTVAPVVALNPVDGDQE